MKLEVDGTSARAIVQTPAPDEGIAPTKPAANVVATVEIDWSRVPDERILHAVCDCKQFAAGTACGHIWASLLELAANEPNSQPPGSGRVSLRKTRPPQVSIPGSALNAMDPADAAPSEPPRPSRRTRRSRSRRRRRTPTTTSWRSVVDAVREDIDRQDLPEKASSARHGEPEIRFLINAATSRNAGGLMIDIFGRKRNPQGEFGKLKRLNIDHAKVEELLGLNPLDADASSTNGASPTAEPAMVTALPPEAPQRQGRKRKAGRG
ncbi:MAG: hypothetical protein OYL92_14895, partial [Acidobacteriota bacterium]|nr:hypothetical protein [Acidobacteriota bacterium]